MKITRRVISCLWNQRKRNTLPIRSESLTNKWHGQANLVVDLDALSFEHKQKNDRKNAKRIFIFAKTTAQTFCSKNLASHNYTAVAERLRRSTRNRLGFSRVGSSPAGRGHYFFAQTLFRPLTCSTTGWIEACFDPPIEH